jgi:transposase
MGNGSGVSRGDRNRNARLVRHRELVPVTNAIVGIDLADKKQMVVVTDHDSKELARKTFRCRAWELGAALDWAGKQAAAKGWAGVTVACEPTGHRWRIVDQLATERGLGLVCVQPLLVWRAREAEDLTFDKTDEKDAVIIARLTAQLRCYVPEPVDETWGRLRHLGARREQLLVEMVSQVQQMRALLECVWPAALETARQPFRSSTWTAAMSVILDRDGGDLARTRRLGLERFEAAVRREIIRRGKQKPCLRIAGLLFTALRRSGRGDQPPLGCAGTGRAAAGRLVRDPPPAARHRDPDDDGPGRAAADRAGHLDHRPVRDRRGSDPGRDRRPPTLRHREGVGQTLRPGTAGEAIRQVRRPHQTHRPGPA